MRERLSAMMAILMSWTAILLSVTALGAAILGVRLLVPISAMDYPREWAVVIILGVLGGTTAVTGAIYWLSDVIAARLVSTPDSQQVEAKLHLCMFCLASLPRDALVCRDCGALVPTYHPRGHAALSALATGSNEPRQDDSLPKGG